MSARLRSDLYTSALIRRVFSAGGFAAVLRKGAEEAGAIFIRQRARDGSETLYGPAPQSLFSAEDDDEGRALERRFERRLTAIDPAAIDAAMERETRFDPDLWLVELETEAVDGLIPLAEGD